MGERKNYFHNDYTEPITYGGKASTSLVGRIHRKTGRSLTKEQRGRGEAGRPKTANGLRFRKAVQRRVLGSSPSSRRRAAPGAALLPGAGRQVTANSTRHKEAE